MGTSIDLQPNFVFKIEISLSTYEFTIFTLVPGTNNVCNVMQYGLWLCMYRIENHASQYSDIKNIKKTAVLQLVKNGELYNYCVCQSLTKTFQKWKYMLFMSPMHVW